MAGNNAKSAWPVTYACCAQLQGRISVHCLLSNKSLLTGRWYSSRAKCFQQAIVLTATYFPFSSSRRLLRTHIRASASPPPLPGIKTRKGDATNDHIRPFSVPKILCGRIVASYFKGWDQKQARGRYTERKATANMIIATKAVSRDSRQMASANLESPIGDLKSSRMLALRQVKSHRYPVYLASNVFYRPIL